MSVPQEVKPFCRRLQIKSLKTTFSVCRTNQLILLFGCLMGNFASTSYALCSKGLGAYVSRDFPALLPPGWQSLQWLFIDVVGSLLVLCSEALYFKWQWCFPSRSSLQCWRISSLRSFCAEVNAQTVTPTFQKWFFYHRIFGPFGGASEPGFTICDRFVVSLCTVAEG